VRRALKRFPRLNPTDWALPAAILVVLLVVALAGSDAGLALRYERAGVLRGEGWRLLTGHLVHAHVPHLVWNMLGTLLIWALFAGEFTVGGWIAVILASTAAIDLGFLLLEPGLAWYVGLSGVLHGLMAAGLVAWSWHRRDTVTMAVAVLFVGKLAWEHLRGPLPFTAATLSVPVVHEAHSYGAIGGALCAIVLLARRGRAARSL
jgi:rhomboid family GlyGly-CTERM serine protease